MKSMAALCILLVLAVIANGEVAKAPGSRANLSIGYIQSGDRLLYRRYVQQRPIPNAVQYQDVTFRGNRNTRIRAIRASEVGYSQYASARVLRGGIGYANVTLRVQSARGFGYHYLIEIFGR